VTTTPAPRPLLVAHRGAATIAPEHTIPAYEAAVAAGADALWLDVQETADEHLVVSTTTASSARRTAGVRCAPVRSGS
jgi:glycerophosphoryl diester phosphodiesterase